MAERIGFIGLGQMGQAMASNLLRAGYSLHVYNRTSEKAAALAGQGAKVVRHPTQTAEPGGIVITSLANDHAVESVVLGDQGLLDRLGPNGIHVSMSTIAPATARRLAEHHQKYQVSYVAAPVFGRPEAAAARQLWIVLSGPQAAKDRVRPILAALGQGLFDFGETPWAANIVKLCGNFLIAAAIEAIGEALALAEKNGIDRERVADMLGQTLFACPVYQGYGQRIATHRYEPAGFRLALGLKDLDLVLQTAAATQVPMPVASLLRDRFVAAMAKGRSDLDWAAIALGIAEDAGTVTDHTKEATMSKRTEKKAVQPVVTDTLSRRGASTASGPTPEEIEQRAYEIYLARGASDGRALEDWLQAERELRENVLH